MELDKEELEATKNMRYLTKNKCKNCKYFERNKEEYCCNKYGNCNCTKFVYGSSFIHNDSRYNDYNEEKADELLYKDYEGYSAGFEVGENFGCIHFEKGE